MTDALPAAETTPRALDQPLPEALTGRSQGWQGRYRRWPVYSAAWQRGRLRTWSLWLGLLLMGLAGAGGGLWTHTTSK